MPSSFFCSAEGALNHRGYERVPDHCQATPSEASDLKEDQAATSGEIAESCPSSCPPGPSKLRGVDGASRKCTQMLANHPGRAADSRAGYHRVSRRIRTRPALS